MVNSNIKQNHQNQIIPENQINKRKIVARDWFVSVCGADAWFAVGLIWDKTIYYTAIKLNINFDRHFLLI